MTEGVLIAGTHSGVGKTTVALGLMAALTRMGRSVQPYKVGPDYIDPSHHTAICGRPSRNLDAYIMGAGAIKNTYANGRGADISIIEGVMGLYDGLDASEVASSAHVAKILGVPVVLVVDVRGMSRSAAALVKGYRSFDPDIEIGGLILNRAGSRRHRKLVEDSLKAAGIDIPVVGALPPDNGLSIPSRHLGLHMAHENVQDYQKLADFISSNVDMDLLAGISSTAVPSEYQPEETAPQADVKIGVARDAAFCFYYQDMLDNIRHLGAEIIPFSPLSNKLPDIDGLILGGGYPELFPSELSGGPARSAIRKAAQEGMPVYAECGGLMYLGKDLEVGGRKYEMAGVLDTSSRMVPKFQALGYTEAQARCDNVMSLKGQSVRGHEFHYSVTECPRDARFAYWMHRGRGIEAGLDGIMQYNTLAGYMHTHPAALSMERFINAARRYKRR